MFSPYSSICTKAFSAMATTRFQLKPVCGFESRQVAGFLGMYKLQGCSQFFDVYDT
jgi:hypothetical protein